MRGTATTRGRSHHNRLFGSGKEKRKESVLDGLVLRSRKKKMKAIKDVQFHPGQEGKKASRGVTTYF